MPSLFPRGSAARSVRVHLLLLVLGVLLPTLGFVGILAWRFAAAEQDRLEQRAVDVARETTASLDRQFADLLGDTRMLAASDALAEGDLAAFHRQALAAQGSIGALEIALRLGQGAAD